MLYLLESTKYFKIGFTENLDTLQTRMQSYRTHNPEFSLIGVKDGDVYEEKEYHLEFEGDRIKGTEWFLLNKNIEYLKDIFKPIDIFKKQFKTKSEKFKETILDNSISSEYLEALKEWYIDEYIYTEKNGICICGQKNISKIVIIHNKYNKKSLNIGCDCAKTFGYFEINNQKLNRAKTLHLIDECSTKIIGKPFKPEYCGVFYAAGFLSDWEFEFLGSILFGSRGFSYDQEQIFKRICLDIKDRIPKPNKVSKYGFRVLDKDFESFTSVESKNKIKWK